MSIEEEDIRTLMDTRQQRGIAWRQEKIRAVAKLLNDHIPELTILKRLMVGGLREETAKNIVAMAYIANEIGMPDIRSEAERGAERVTEARQNNGAEEP